MTLKENIRRAIAHDSPDHVPYYQEGGIQLVSHRGALPPDNGYDLWGVRWRKGVDESLPYPVEHPVTSLSQLGSCAFPDPTDPALFDDLPASMDRANNLVVGCHFTALFERLWCLCGMENALVWMLEDTGAVADFLQRLAEWHLEIAGSFVGLGVDAGRISDDYGTQESLLMSPALWRRAVKPALSRIIRFYKSSNLLVFLHSCGRITAIIRDLVEMGIDAFNIQTATNDLAALRREYGRRFTIVGGIDTQETMTRGTPEIVALRVKEAIATLGGGGGLIVEPDQRVSMPRENVLALIEAARRYGAYR